MKHPRPEFAPVKAGVQLFEDRPDGTRQLLVPYNEGRFARNGFNFVLPKGSVDYHKGESAPRGAIRETSEESGFPLDDFMGEENIARFEAGEHRYNITNPRYPGITLVHADPTPLLSDYHSRSGKVNTLAMYRFEMTGLDAIAQNYVKNPERKTTKMLLDADRSRPRFPVFFDWMMQGEIPADGKLPRVKLGNPQWFAAQIRQYAQGGEFDPNAEHAREQWQEFLATLSADDPCGKKYAKLRQSFSDIKDRLRDKGWIKGDEDILKFDEKDCPLFWYAEGGFVGPAHEILGKILCDMRENDDYARAFGGRGTRNTHLAADEAMMLGQVAAFGALVRPQDWTQALQILANTPGMPVAEHRGFISRILCEEAKPAACWAEAQTPPPASRQFARR